MNFLRDLLGLGHSRAEPLGGAADAAQDPVREGSTPQEPWPELEVDSWETFARFAAGIRVELPGVLGWLSRGQADAEWPLQSSLLRRLPAGMRVQRALLIEQLALVQFRRQARLHLPSAQLPPMDGADHTLPEWWARMQHYRAPTRFVDWSHSIYVAAYFAVEREWERPGAIYLHDAGAVSREMQRRYGKLGDTSNYPDDATLRSSDAPEVVFYLNPLYASERLVAQQGSLTACANIMGDQGEIIRSICGDIEKRDPKRLGLRKVIIPARLKPDFLLRLRSMNIGALSLFPGLDGLGIGIAESVLLACAEDGSYLVPAPNP